MAVDENSFFARRLGFGLRPGATLPAAPREWGVEQIKSIPPLDFYGKDGKSLIAKLPPTAKPLTDFEQACREWEVYDTQDEKAANEARDMSGEASDHYIFERVVFPYMHIPRWRDCLEKTLTAVNGPSPVFERFWMFWLNHFTVSTPDANIKLFYGPHTRNIRNRMTGRFEDMLIDAILNPAMLVYLDNWLSTGPNSEHGKSGDESLNENLARELLELHTMSSAGGYTQKDVIETALVLTGWQFYAGARTHGKAMPGVPYGTYFHMEKHEPGTRTVLGKKYAPKNDGGNQAPDLLRDLAAHPATAKHISWKLARHFIADQPPADSVERIRAAWVKSNGDLIAIHTAVIDEVLTKASDNPKFMTPENWLLQSFVVTGVPPPLGQPIWGREEIHWTFKELGQAYDECPQPNGWSDLQQDWISKEMLDRRIRYAYHLGRQIGGDAAEALKDYSVQLAGKKSDLAKQVARAESAADATAFLLVSPQFLKI